MKLIAVTIENFRCYLEPRTIQFDDLTTLIGRNDIGKSSVLEALEIFFNNDVVSVDVGDANVYSADKTVRITCEFGDLPEKLTVDAGAATSLKDEYLLTTNETLKIQKVYDCSKKPSAEVYILAHHPTAEGVSNLLELKEKDLQKLVKDLKLTAALKGNPGMRAAIWAAAADLKLEEVALPVSKPKDEVKRIWEQIEAHIPLYALFQSDRASRDSDDEVQNPLKAAVAAAIAEVQPEIDRIQAKVQDKAVEIAKLTHGALKEIDAALASTLNPLFTPPTASKWVGLFNLGMDTDDGIPLNKRGSGVRRLVLVGFFKAEAERKLISTAKRSIIYAVEEPETSQHPRNQQVLIDSFKQLATNAGCQILLTTHSPGLAADLPVQSIRFISNAGPRTSPFVESGADVFGKVAEALGLVPDSRVKVLLYVEGPTDVQALKCMSSALHSSDNTIINLATDPRIAFVLYGGSTLKHWVTENYLGGLKRPEVHLCDRDVADYAAKIADVNARTDGLGSWGAQTAKYEIECYLHTAAIKQAFGVDVEVIDEPTAGKELVPKAFGQAYSALKKHDGVMKDGKCKQYLATQAFPLMTPEWIAERDPNGEIEGWLRRIANML